MKQNFKQLIGTNKKVLVDFYATWCGPCKMMQPILKELKGLAGDDVRIVKIDVDKNPKVAAAYQVRGVPTLIIFKNGRARWRQAGVVEAKQLKKVLDGIQ